MRHRWNGSVHDRRRLQAVGEPSWAMGLQNGRGLGNGGYPPAMTRHRRPRPLRCRRPSRPPHPGGVDRRVVLHLGRSRRPAHASGSRTRVELRLDIPGDPAFSEHQRSLLVERFGPELGGRRRRALAAAQPRHRPGTAGGGIANAGPQRTRTATRAAGRRSGDGEAKASGRRQAPAPPPRPRRQPSPTPRLSRTGGDHRDAGQSGRRGGREGAMTTLPVLAPVNIALRASTGDPSPWCRSPPPQAPLGFPGPQHLADLGNRGRRRATGTRHGRPLLDQLR